MTSQLDDARMEELFSAFDDVHASDDAKSRVLGVLADEPVEARAVRGKRPRRVSRIVRIAAAAACVAALSVGGVAYALPASSVTVSVGGESVELGVNCFGLTVSAAAGDDEVQRLVDEAQVRNLPYDESIGRVLDSMSAQVGEPISVNVEARDERVREQMEARGAEVVGERSADFPDGSQQLPPRDAAEAPVADGTPGEPGAPAPGAGPASPESPASPQPPASPEPSESTASPAMAQPEGEPQAPGSESASDAGRAGGQLPDQPQDASDRADAGQPSPDQPDDAAPASGQPASPEGGFAQPAGSPAGR